MTVTEKKEKITKLVKIFLENAHNDMVSNIKRALDSGAINIEEWDEEINAAVLPKTITIALFKDKTAALERTVKGTSFEKQTKKEVKNLQYFL